jgi:hypothetical protein
VSLKADKDIALRRPSVETLTLIVRDVKARCDIYVHVRVHVATVHVHVCVAFRCIRIQYRVYRSIRNPISMCCSRPLRRASGTHAHNTVSVA